MAQDELFGAERNALLVHNTEEYYRQMYPSGASWNLRDRHMASTLENAHHAPREPQGSHQGGRVGP